MKRNIIIASHNHMASGLKSTLEFIAGKQDNVTVLDAYVNGKNVEDDIKNIFNNIDPKTEIIVFTDMMAGSVNQKFFPYRSRPHTHIITGMNLPVILATVLFQKNTYMTGEDIHKIVDDSRQAIQYVNEFSFDNEEDE